jgi:hypothetical protein
MAVGTDGAVTGKAVIGNVVAGNVVDGGGVVDARGLIDVVVTSVDTRVDDGGVAVSTTGTLDAMSSSPPQPDIHMPVAATSVTPPRRLRSFTATPSANRCDRIISPVPPTAKRSQTGSSCAMP